MLRLATAGRQATIERQPDRPLITAFGIRHIVVGGPCGNPGKDGTTLGYRRYAAPTGP